MNYYQYYLLLKSKDMSNTTIHGISKPCLSFIANCDHRIKPLIHRNVEEQLGNVTGTKNLVHSGKVRGTLLRIKVRSKDATGHALSPQKLARPTRATTTTIIVSTATTPTTYATTRVYAHL